MSADTDVVDVNDLVTGSVVVDRVSPVPLYYQVAQQLEAAIAEHRLPPGTKLDNEIALAERLGLSRPTMRKAIEYLVDKGLVVRRRGVGTRVVHASVRRPLDLTSLYDDLAATGRSPRTDVLSHAVKDAPAEVAEALRVPAGSAVHVVERLRWAGEQPIAKMRNYLPADLLDLSAESLTSSGLYQLMRAAGIQLHAATQVIGARNATAAEAALLAEKRGAALLTMTRTAYDDTGRAVEYGTHVYAAARYTFEINMLAH